MGWQQLGGGNNPVINRKLLDILRKLFTKSSRENEQVGERDFGIQTRALDNRVAGSVEGTMDSLGGQLQRNTTY
jgi:ribosomal protein S17E